MGFRSRILVVAVATFAGPVFAQSGVTRQDDSAIRVNVELVNLLSTVHDKSGAYVNNLSKDDFIVLENGRPQTITHFARQTDAPLTVALLLDLSGSMDGVLEKETRAASDFFHNILRPGDRAALVSFATYVAALEGLTSDQHALDSALGRPGLLSPMMRAQPTVMERSSNMVLIKLPPDSGSRLFDAVYTVSEQRLSGVPGRKAIVALTDGDDCGSMHSLQDAVRAAQESDAAIYGVHYDGKYPNHPGRSNLKDMSGPTGGRTFHVDKNMPIEKIFAAIEEEMRNQYAIGFAPPVGGKTGSFHKVQLKVSTPGLTVQSRNGYYR